jgi:hypothetical protein
MRDKYTGNDNHGKPKADYLAKIAAMTDDQLFAQAKDAIWFSAFAANNPRSDYHWQCDAVYDECQRREDKTIYDRAHKQVMRENGH